MTQKKIGGYQMKNDLARAMNANRIAQEALRRLLNDEPGPQTRTILLARALSSLSENLDALISIKDVVGGEVQQ